MLFDTDILIWVLRGYPKAIKTLDASEQRALSVVNYMELLHGARDRREARGSEYPCVRAQSPHA